MILRLGIGVAVFLLAIGDPEPLDAAVALAVCAAAQALAHRHLRPDTPSGARPPLWRAVTGIPALAWFTLADVVTGTIEVARVSLRPSLLESPGFVEVELDRNDDAGAVTTALLLTLSPGSFVVDISPERPAMLVHVLDASDPEAVRAHVRALTDRRRKVL